MTTTRILDGKAVAAEVRRDLAQRVTALIEDGGRVPKLVAVLVGENPASKAYVGSKAKGCLEVGMQGETLQLPGSISTRELLRTLEQLNEDDSVDGILVQLPLPEAVEERTVLEAVSPAKDVDGFHPQNVGRLWLGQPCLAPATPSGIMQLLKRSEIELGGKQAVIVGRSAIVGKPMAALLLAANCTVTVCHSRTRDLSAVCRQADILVAAIGRPAFIGAEHVGEGAVVVDVGINRISDPDLVERLYPGDEKRRRQLQKRGSTLVGDVDFNGALPLASAITPVPGGVGPLTVAQVLVNTFEASCRRQGREP